MSAEHPAAQDRRFWQRVWDRLHWCRARSPEGYECIYRRGHDGLHVPHMGRGYAWGGDSSDVDRDQAAAQGRLSFKENVVMRLIGLVIFVAPTAGVRFLASVTEGVIERIGESRA